MPCSKKSFPCKKCKHGCSVDCIQCHLCLSWRQYDCAGLTEDEFLSYANDNSLNFMCSERCKMCLFPFNSYNGPISNDKIESVCNISEPLHYRLA